MHGSEWFDFQLDSFLSVLYSCILYILLIFLAYVVAYPIFVEF